MTDIRLVTPAGWFDLDLDPRTARRQHERLVRRRVGGGPEHADLRGQILAHLDEVAERARADGARFASVFSEIYDRVPVAASMLGFVSRSVDHDGLEAAAERLRTAAPEAEVDVVDLPAGPAVRRRSTVDIQADGVFTTGGGQPRTKTTANLEFFVPMPDGERTLVLAFSTPTLVVADAMIELFDAMAQSLRWPDGGSAR